MLERRFVKGQQVKIRAGSSKPAIEGYASIFNEKYDSGWFIETIKPQAFARALKEKQDVRCLFNHQPDNLLGRTKSGTLNLKEDQKGLFYSCDLNPETRIATEVHAMVSRGDLDGCSFAFRVRKQSWREETDADGKTVNYREIEDLDLYDVGPVTYPAYEGTSVGARALWPEGVPEEIRSHVPALREMKPGADMGDTPSDPGDGNTDPDNDGDNDTDPAKDTDNDMEECSCRCRACFGGDCEECEDYMETCGDPEHCNGAMRSAHIHSERRGTDGKKTKRVAGEDLTASAFAYVGDPEKTETWKLPIKFSSEEKTKAHIRNALARFSQTKGIPESEKPKVLAKIKAAAKKYGIHVSDEQKSDAISLELAKARTETLMASMSQ